MKSPIKAVVGGLVLGASLLSPSIAEAKEARVCTRHYDGILNLRKGPSTNSPKVGVVRNEQFISLSGGFHDSNDGYTWYQLKSGAWVRGDFLCVTPQRPTPPPTPTGPGNYWGK